MKKNLLYNENVQILLDYYDTGDSVRKLLDCLFEEKSVYAEPLEKLLHAVGSTLTLEDILGRLEDGTPYEIKNFDTMELPEGLDRMEDGSISRIKDPDKLAIPESKIENNEKETQDER